METRILAVDDEPSIRRLYCRLFGEGGYILTLAGSVGEAAGFLESGQYDLLITDLSLPDGTGLELVRQFKDSGSGRSIIVSGALAPEDLSRLGRKEGALRTFSKPFELDKLLRCVNSVSGT